MTASKPARGVVSAWRKSRTSPRAAAAPAFIWRARPRGPSSTVTPGTRAGASRGPAPAPRQAAFAPRVGAPLVVDLGDAQGPGAPRGAQVRPAAGLPVQPDDLDD